MQLLYDQNLPQWLVAALAGEYPHSAHVKDASLESADDERIWQYARENNFIIVSKDTDFLQRSLVLGHPPKVVWLDVGNCNTARIEALLRSHHENLRIFGKNIDASFFILR